MADELKPCPFCGGEGCVICGSSFEFGFPSYAVECEKCGTVGIVKASEQEAIEAWNTRAERTCRNLGGEEGTNYELYDFGCSACGYCTDITEPNYCPYCGAKVVK